MTAVGARWRRTHEKARAPGAALSGLGRVRRPHAGARDRLQHAARTLCSNLSCQRFLKWLPKVLLGAVKDERGMDSVNFLLISGVLDRVTLRFREDGTPVCTGALLLRGRAPRAASFGPSSRLRPTARTGEQVGAWQSGTSLAPKASCWRKYHTKSGEEKSGLALLVQKGSVLVPAPALPESRNQENAWKQKTTICCKHL